MTILVYPSVLPGEPMERHEAEGITLDRWMRDNVKGYASGPEQPVSATVDGVVVDPAQWGDTWLTAERNVQLRPQPKAAAVPYIIAAVVAIAVAVIMRPSLPSQGNRKSQRGSSIYEASAQGNRPKLGDVIPEIAGRHKTYPDYLTAPRRYFANTKSQGLDLLLCVGKGDYTIPDAGIKIGATPISALGNDVNYQIFQPGESVAGHQAHRRWYNAPEVGASVGSSGLRLRSASTLTSSLEATAVTLDGQNFTVPSGAGTAPGDWAVGMLLTIDLLQEIDVTDGGQDGSGNYLRDVLSGDFPAFSVGDAVTISGGSSIGGDYLVNTFTAGTPDEMTLDNADSSPAAFLPSGMYMAAIDYTGVRYRITAILTNAEDKRIGFTVGRLNPDGTVDSSWGGWPTQTTSDFSIRLDSSAINSDWSGPFLACPEGEVTNLLEWDIFAPQGLGELGETSGNIYTRTRTVELQWRDYGTTTWHSITRNVSGGTRDQLGWTFTETLPSAVTPEVRVRRVGAERTGALDLDRLEWYGLRCRLAAKTNYPGVTILAITLTGSDTIASQTENQVSVIATRRLPVRINGVWQPSQATRDIAPWLAHIAHSVGYTDDEIDLDELDRLDSTWRARGDFFDWVQDDDSTVKESLVRALRAGMSDLTIDQGRLRPARDEPRSTFEHMYSPQNMLRPLKRVVQAPRPSDPDGVDVEYFSAETWTQETVECRLPGDNGFRAEKLRVEGVTSKTKAWQLGMRQCRKQRYQRWQYDFSTELDALNSRYLSYCALADDIPGYAQSALIEAVEVDGDNVHLQSSEPLQWQEGEASHVIAWRRPDGTLAGPFPAQPGDDEHHVISQMDEVPVIDLRREPPHLLFGTTTEWCFPVLVTSIRPRGFESVSVECVNYDERVYADDNNSP